MAESDKVHFFDMRCINGEAWFINRWESLSVLNYKCLPYTMEWITYLRQQRKTRLTDMDDSWNDMRFDGPHTVPAIDLPDGQGLVTDSRVIADELERLYSEPSLHRQSPCLALVEEAFFVLLSAWSGVWLPELSSKVMKPDVTADWRAHRGSVSVH
ncbi:uncharacterized protein BKA55DRAFT_529897 [Fusarium redolens]|uniref:GST N-terminal domain-containing protein n=1 Tax=Fusarium redolens TaxID=48865 RepID=A0A9P9JKF1_FUSRE|nr:uncharacterized protein BKA55DRAFT_529897 [Fusarium redolens]KAH7207841.1 hypothetical protein BKA55DRAFT_529897 [Fusarium redolens]